MMKKMPFKFTQLLQKKEEFSFFCKVNLYSLYEDEKEMRPKRR